MICIRLLFFFFSILSSYIPAISFYPTFQTHNTGFYLDNLFSLSKHFSKLLLCPLCLLTVVLIPHRCHGLVDGVHLRCFPYSLRFLLHEDNPLTIKKLVSSFISIYIYIKHLQYDPQISHMHSILH